MKIALYDDNFKKIVERIRDILNLTELYLYIDSIFKGTSNEWLGLGLMNGLRLGLSSKQPKANS